MVVFAVCIFLLIRFRPSRLPVNLPARPDSAAPFSAARGDSEPRREFQPLRPKPVSDRVADLFGVFEEQAGLATAAIAANLEYLDSGVEPNLVLVGARLDSARAAVKRAREAEGELGRIEKTVASGSRYRFSVLQVAARKHRELVEQQLGDGLAMLGALRSAELARAAGEAGEAEIQLNVATSYLRQAENRQRRLARQAAAARQALAELLRAGVD